MRNREWIRQFIKFCIIGGSNVAVAYVAYLAALKLTGILFVSTFSGYVFSTLNSFFWNNGWVFKKDEGERRSWVKALARMFFMYAATGIFLNYFLLLVWVKVLGISEIIAPVINSIIGIPINFLVSKFWCFKAEKDGSEE